MFDPLLLARVQFAFTISFHIIFPAFTIGLASYLALIEWRYLQTKREEFLEIYKFLVKIFAVTFGMGVVSGIVLPYEFGTNWANFSLRTANVLGPLMSYEVLTAFFLEASFLGIMLFGWNKVSVKIHFLSTAIVAVGTLISAFWILSVNSWMQTPSGFVLDSKGIFYPTNWLEVIFNPSFPYRFCHMVLASYITTAFSILGIASWYLLKKKFVEHAKIMQGMSLAFLLVAVPLQIVVGDMHGLNTQKFQPAKIAAMEGAWETKKGAPLLLFGIPNQDDEVTRYEVAIPKLASIILKHDAEGEVVGMKDFAKELRPPMAPVFYAFRIMVGLGFLMLLTVAIAVFLHFRKQLSSAKKFHILSLAMAPSGFIALLAGWYVTEIGRQPFVVYGLFKTSEAASAVLASQVSFSLIAFVLVYFFIFGAAIFYILRLIKKGVGTAKNKSSAYV